MSLTPSRMIKLGSPLPAFRLPDGEGNEVGSTDFAERPVLVAFICNHCRSLSTSRMPRRLRPRVPVQGSYGGRHP